MTAPPGEIVVLHRERYYAMWTECPVIEDYREQSCRGEDDDSTPYEHLVVVPAAALAEAQRQMDVIRSLANEEHEKHETRSDALAEARKEGDRLLREIEQLEEHGVPSARVLALDAELSRLRAAMHRHKTHSRKCQMEPMDSPCICDDPRDAELSRLRTENLELKGRLDGK